MSRATLAEVATLAGLAGSAAAVLYIPGLFRLIAGL
jgi:hypothetical protein